MMGFAALYPSYVLQVINRLDARDSLAMAEAEMPAGEGEGEGEGAGPVGTPVPVAAAPQASAWLTMPRGIRAAVFSAWAEDEPLAHQPPVGGHDEDSDAYGTRRAWDRGNARAASTSGELSAGLDSFEDGLEPLLDVLAEDALRQRR